MKKFLFTSCLLFTLKLCSQLSGVIFVPGTYSSLGAVINDLNTQGISSGVTVNIATGYTETATSGGYSLYATGSSLSPIVFKKSGTGANPVIYAYAGGNKTPGSASQDGIFRLIGSDYITIDGLSFVDPNTTNPSTMEFGIALFKASATNGCFYNTIKNCQITLRKSNNAAGAGPASDGSRGIEICNALPSTHNQHLVVTSVAGSNSYNKLFGNAITNCNIGISAIGYSVAGSSLSDLQNEIGGQNAVQGNQVLNFGGGGSNASAGIRTLYQQDLVISRNSLDNNNGSGINHTATLRGIYNGNSAGSNCAINNNTITVRGGGTTSQLVAIENTAGSAGTSNTVSIMGNLVINCSNKNATSGSFYGIWNSASAANLQVKGNKFYNNSSNASSGSTYLIYNSGAVSQSISFLKNDITFKFHSTSPYSGTTYGIYNNGSTTNCIAKIDSNTFSHFYHTMSPGTGPIYFINNSSALSDLSIMANRCENLVMNHNGHEYFIYGGAPVQNSLAVTSNSLLTYTQTVQSGNLYGYFSSTNAASTCVQYIRNNIFSGIHSLHSTGGTFSPIYSADGNTSPYPRKLIEGNFISDIHFASTGSLYGIHVSDCGDAGSGKGSSISSNTISNITFGGQAYLLHLASPTSSLLAVEVKDNVITGVAAIATVQALYVASASAGAIISGNKIAGVTSSSNTAFGILCAGSSSTSIYNNIVGNIYASFAGGASRCNGIYISSGSRVELDYNTIFLSGTSSGSHFGSNALFAATTATVILNNNIISNSSVPTGTGVTAAYRRSSSTMTSYLTGSDRNLFYAGTPGLQNVIFDNGTKYQTLSAFTLFVSPRESSSVSQLSQFKSQAAASSNFLHLTDNVANVCESGGVTSGSKNNDFDKDVRFGFTGYAGSGTATDIGADEFDLFTTPCNSVSAALVTPAHPTICAGGTVSVLGSGFTRGTGIVHQWKVSPASGGTFTNVAGGAGSSSEEFYSGTLTPGTYFYRLETTCSLVPVTAVSPEVTVVVQTVPSVSISAASIAACVGQSLQLSVISNTNSNFLWRGPYGFYSENQNPWIIFSDTLESGTYSVVAENHGCTSAVSQVTVDVSEIDLELFVAGTSVCSGQSATLTAFSSGATYSWSTLSNSPSIIVTPTATTLYSVVAGNTSNCTVTALALVTVADPTLTVSGALSCLPVQQATLSAQAFTPSTIKWYNNILDSVEIFSGLLYPVSNSLNTTYYVEAGSGIKDSLLVAAQSPTAYTGEMLDVVAINDLDISGLDLPIAGAGNVVIEIWSRVGSYLTFNSSNAGWSLSGTFSVNSQGSGSLSPVFFPSITLNAGERRAFYIVVVSGSAMSVIASTANGTTLSQNANLKIGNGIAGSGYFNLANNPAGFCGVVRYRTKGCKSARVAVTHTVSAPPSMTVSASPSVVCAGASSTLAALGAVGYTWQGGSKSSTLVVKVFSGSLFTVTGQNATGCIATKTISVQAISLPTVYAIALQTVVCPSSPATFSATGAVSFTWSTGAIGNQVTVFPPAHGIYSVTGTGTNGCINSGTIAVSTKTVPAVKVEQSRTLVCAEEEVILSALGAGSYTWYPSGVSGKTLTVSPVVSSVYNAMGLSANGCTAIAMAIVTVEECASLDPRIKSAPVVYPNPASSFLTVEHINSEVWEISILTSLGEQLINYKDVRTPYIIDTNTWPCGLYFVLIKDGATSSCIKLVVER